MTAEGAASGERLLLAELVTFHRLHPGEHEVITEGRADASVIRWFLESLEMDTPVYTISTRIEVGKELMDELGLPVGERSRLIAAARYMEEASDVDADSVSFVIDGDYAYTLDPPVPSAPSLLVTDFSCIESYCLEPSILGKYLAVVLHEEAIDPTAVIHAISGVLADFFAIRWLLHHLQGSPTMVGKISNKVRLLDGVLSLDVDSLLRDSVAGSEWEDVRKLTKSELRQSFDKIRGSFEVEARYCMNGHDLAQCLNWYLMRAFGKFFTNERRGFADAFVACRAWMGCLEMGYLLTTDLFSELRRRALTSAS
jgi:hypothetical protein